MLQAFFIIRCHCIRGKALQSKSHLKTIQVNIISAMQAVFSGNGLMAILAGLVANTLVTNMKVYTCARARVFAYVCMYVHKSASMHARAQDHAITSAHMLCTCTHRLPVRPSLTLQLGPVSPFDASALVLTVGGVGIAMLWGENYGESRHQHSLSEQFQMAFAAIMSGALSCAGHFTSILVPCSVHYGCVLL